MEINSTIVFKKNFDTDKKITINRWWTRSSKTYALLQLIFVRLKTWKIDNTRVFTSWVCSIVRKHKSTLKWTVMRDWESIIEDSWDLFLLDKECRNKTDRTYTYKWRVVEFLWADDQQKLRGWKRDILYCNEANELLYDQEFFQLLIRTTYKIFLDFNPDNEYVRINTELEQKRKTEEWDVAVIVSTYKDNTFLPVELVREIERLELANPAYRQIYWLWKYGKLEGIIFPSVIDIEAVPDEAKLLGYWLDFGFTNDPSTLVGLYQYNWWIILDEEFYEYWLMNTDIFARIKSRGLWLKEKYVADSAEPKSIEELFRMWLNIEWVKKWPDSIMYGLQTMLQQSCIYITSRSSNLRRELKWYVRDKNKKWEAINSPASSPDHCIDAWRYICMKMLWRMKQWKAWIQQAKR